MKSHNLDTTGWNEFPFTASGINYVSKVSPDSPFMDRIKNLPYGVFETMNIGAIRELVGANLTHEQIATRLQEINSGATHAVIEIG